MYINIGLSFCETVPLRKYWFMKGADYANSDTTQESKESQEEGK